MIRSLSVITRKNKNIHKFFPFSSRDFIGRTSKTNEIVYVLPTINLLVNEIPSLKVNKTKMHDC